MQFSSGVARANPGARAATHSGSWYSNNGQQLKRQIVDLLHQARPAVEERLQGGRAGSKRSVRAIISPHAGLSYSGLTAAHGFASLGDIRHVRRVFILGPSHHSYFEEIRASPFASYETPLGSLPVDRRTIKELIEKGGNMNCPIKMLTQEQDEDEHSIEMQTPFIASLTVPKDTAQSAAQIVPLVVGHIDHQAEQRYGRLLAPYLADPSNLFVISSDFCHWGPRFRYQYHFEPQKYPDIGDAVIAMDHLAMQLIEKQDQSGLTAYFEKTNNTICGRAPIGILLEAVNQNKGRFSSPSFLHYSQSNRCKKPTDMSVSYAAGVVAAT